MANFLWAVLFFQVSSIPFIDKKNKYKKKVVLNFLCRFFCFPVAVTGYYRTVDFSLMVDTFLVFVGYYIGMLLEWVGSLRAVSQKTYILPFASADDAQDAQKVGNKPQDLLGKITTTY